MQVEEAHGLLTAARADMRAGRCHLAASRFHACALLVGGEVFSGRLNPVGASAGSGEDAADHHGGDLAISDGGDDRVAAVPRGSPPYAYLAAALGGLAACHARLGAYDEAVRCASAHKLVLERAIIESSVDADGGGTASTGNVGATTRQERVLAVLRSKADACDTLARMNLREGGSPELAIEYARQAVALREQVWQDSVEINANQSREERDAGIDKSVENMGYAVAAEGRTLYEEAVRRREALLRGSQAVAGTSSRSSDLGGNALASGGDETAMDRAALLASQSVLSEARRGQQHAAESPIPVSPERGGKQRRRGKGGGARDGAQRPPAEPVDNQDAEAGGSNRGGKAAASKQKAGTMCKPAQDLPDDSTLTPPSETRTQSQPPSEEAPPVTLQVLVTLISAVLALIAAMVVAKWFGM